MQFTYESQGTNTFLVYEMMEEQVIDSVTMGMIGNNRIEGIFSFNYSQLDKKRYLKYNVSSRVSLTQYFSGIVNKNRLIGVMESIAKAVLNAQEYMIEVENFVWDAEYIFVDVTNATAQMVCLPIMQISQEEVSIEKFLKNMLLSVQFDQTENCDYVAKLLGFFNANIHFSLHDFVQVLRTLHDDNKPTEQQLTGGVTENTKVESKEEIKEAYTMYEQKDSNAMFSNVAVEPQKMEMNIPVNAVKQEDKSKENKKGISLFGKKDSKELKKNNNMHNMNIPPSGGAVPFGNSNFVQPPQINNLSTPNPDTNNATQGIGNHYVAPSYQTQKASFGGTVVLNESNKTDGTVLLNASNEVKQQKTVPYLVRMKNQQKIPLTKAVFVLGSDIEKADYPVADNRAVSKRHAELLIKGEQIYLVDNGSTNHTFVAGNMIAPNKEVLLQDKSKFVLANEEFELHIS